MTRVSTKNKLRLTYHAQGTSAQGVTIDKKTLFAQIEPHWVLTRADGENVDSRLLDLLEAVHDSGSLQQAAKIIGLSYRYAWSLARPWSGREGLLLLSRGQGAVLTEAGIALIERIEKARQRWRDEAKRWQDLEIRLETTQARKIHILASHDLLLTDMPSLVVNPSVNLEVDFNNSAEALRQLRNGGCDVAGFHMPVDQNHPLCRYLNTLLDDIPNVVCRPLFTYTQGLMVTRKNMQRVKTLRDLARRKILFVNRQRGSGTRLLFDALLIENDIDPLRIVGYTNEEFTHHAVAATVAAGAAEAGFGSEAAARFFKLAFAPMVEETYYFAWRDAPVSRKTLAAFIAFFDGKVWQKKIKKTTGYRTVDI
ncbi:MAG: helix-turn-helix transcriptional regulator [Burkholderiales bacterium]|jgi:molybdate transport repressor ModE-like protein|nr:helix-turn-helix transcriptional regulator [Burkholderiales bacterium]